MDEFVGKVVLLVGVCAVIFAAAWVTILPTVGLFYVFGWLR